MNYDYRDAEKLWDLWSRRPMEEIDRLLAEAPGQNQSEKINHVYRMVKLNEHTRGAK
uniref:Uncharacterized protein n=1 Tax=viral metagenome TaxID=1070528 RepID=A0A6M3LN69_9ZZZZ